MTAPISTSGSSNSPLPLLPTVGSAATPAATGTGSTTSSGASNPLGTQALDENAFLQMLVAQMQNQDPMNPMDGTQLASQLAQFSTVEQLTQLNATATAQATATQQASNTTLGVSLVGHDVIIPGNSIDASTGEAPQITLDVPAGTAAISVTVTDSTGATVGTQTFKNPTTGRDTFDLSNTIANPGQYSYQATATDGNGKPLTLTTYSTGRVQGVSTNNGDVEVQVDGVMIPISQIVEIVAPVAPAPTTATGTKTTTGTTTTTTPGATN